MFITSVILLVFVVTLTLFSLLDGFINLEIGIVEEKLLALPLILLHSPTSLSQVVIYRGLASCILC